MSAVLHLWGRSLLLLALILGIGGAAAFGADDSAVAQDARTLLILAGLTAVAGAVLVAGSAVRR